MDKNELNINRNASGTGKSNAEEETPKRKSLLEGLEEDAREGAKEALRTEISKESIEKLKEEFEKQPDDMIGEGLDNLLNTIIRFIEEHPNEYVLIKLLWIITMLGTAKSLGGFGRSLTTIAMIKSLSERD